MLPAGVAIEDLLPHRKPMLLITEVIDFDGRKAAARAIVTAQWPLSDHLSADPLVLIELVAQTAGINNGWHLLQREGPDSDHRGWIVGIKSAHIDVDRLAIGTEIMIESENQFEFDSFREIRGIATVRGREVADITLQLMQAEI